MFVGRVLQLLAGLAAGAEQPVGQFVGLGRVGLVARVIAGDALLAPFQGGRRLFQLGQKVGHLGVGEGVVLGVPVQ